MKNIFKVLTIALFAVFVLASCETYKIPETEYTNVSWLDGKYICFATDAAGNKSVCELEITNTTNNDADKAWMTITSYDILESYYSIYYGAATGWPGANMAAGYANAYVNYLYFMAAFRFPITLDPAAKSFSCSAVKGEEPYTCYNSVLGGDGTGPQGYYTGSGQFDGYREFTVTLTNGAVKNGIPTASGKTTDGISFEVNIKDNNIEDFERSWKIEGIRKTGWAEDMQEYIDCFNAQFED